MQHKSGFTLLELLIVLVIIMVLGGFALITYTNLGTKAQVQEAFQMLEEYKVQALHTYNATGAFSSYATLFADGATTNCSGSCAPGDVTDIKNVTAKYVTQVTAKTGTNLAGQRYILLSATINASSYGISAGANEVFIQGIAASGAGNQITWQCIYSVTNSVIAELLPKACVAYVP